MIIMILMVLVMRMLSMTKPSVVVMVVAFCVLVFTMPGVLPAYMDNIILDYTTLCFVSSEGALYVIMPYDYPATF